MIKTKNVYNIFMDGDFSQVMFLAAHKANEVQTLY